MVNITDPVGLIHQLNQRLGDIRSSRSALEQEMGLIGAGLDEMIASIDASSERLKAAITQAPVPPAVPDAAESPVISPGQPGAVVGMSLDDFKNYIEKLFQGSLESVGNKISDRITGMLKDLKGLSGTAREAKMRQIHEAASSEMVDLSVLFTQDAVQSNLGEVGIEEKESEGIDSGLEKLRKMRGLDSKPGKGPKDKKNG